MAKVEEIRKAQRAQDPATILAIGTATPTNCVHQAGYPDYLRITKSEHMTELKVKFKRMFGADRDLAIERPWFQLLSSSQTILPDSEGAIDGHLREVGLTFHLSQGCARANLQEIEKSLNQVFTPIDINDWNSIFWIVHPGGPAILDQVEAQLELQKEKMRATRKFLSEYGNMSSACVLFILDEMRKRSAEEGKQLPEMGSSGELVSGRVSQSRPSYYTAYPLQLQSKARERPCLCGCVLFSLPSLQV
ncbi:Chalcone synthase [Rhynchospora pubera]|uniref:chalcone synthase n=1 Tax=Rhynchospora pubera TaxID=906938 RepID=A0AAV8EGW3_9POAL|nr:Chalcone synthase [Rhynchospora pubera]